MKHVVVLGGSSQIGLFLLPALLEAGMQVTAVSRKAPTGGVRMTPSLSWINGFDDIDRENLKDFSLVSCGPLGLMRPWLRGLQGLQRCIAFSSSSVHTRDTPAIRALRAAEIDVGEHLNQRQIPLCLLRPTLIYGCGMDRNVSLLAAFGRKTGWIPVSSKAEGLRQPIHAEDLAQAALAALVSETPVDLAGEICGGSTLSYRAMVNAIANVSERKIRVASLPPAFYRTAVRVLAMASAWKDLDPGMVDRQAQDLIFDDHLLREKLSLSPRAFNPSEADFEAPKKALSLQLPISSGDDT